MNALDLVNTSSCWNSEGNDGRSDSEQWIQLDFGRPVHPWQLRIQFQAGFSAESCTVQSKFAVESEFRSCWDDVKKLELSDAYDIQVRNIKEEEDLEHACSSLRFVFDDFSDFYGRVTIYQLEVWGAEGSGQ
jgi:hypothetical protein